MNPNHRLTRLLTGALLAGGVAVAGFGIDAGVASMNFGMLSQPGSAVDDGPTSPGVRVGFDPQPDPPSGRFTSPGVRVGFDPQPEPPTRSIAINR